MKMVVGLGNPGRQYAGTRHNVGFDVIGRLAEKLWASAPQQKFEAELIELHHADDKLILLAPQTFMNLSGRSVAQAVRFFQVEPADILVVCDDLNLDVGRLRLKPGGSAGGQKGLKNIIDALGTQDIPRLRIGIGRPPGRMIATDYVLGKFRKEDAETMNVTIEQAVTAIEDWLAEGIEATMNRVNAPPSES